MNFLNGIMMIKKQIISMKAQYLIIILLATAGCNKNNVSKESEKMDSLKSSNLVLKDTIYIHDDQAIVPEDIYLYIDSIKFGDPFTDNNGTYGYYRLIFSSSEETQSLHIEKINIIGDGIVKLDKRFEIPTGVLGNDYILPFIGLIKWQTPEIIVINIDGNKRMELNITKMKAVKIP
jgi:hypothetical protein